MLAAIYHDQGHPVLVFGPYHLDMALSSSKVIISVYFNSTASFTGFLSAKLKTLSCFVIFHV